VAPLFYRRNPAGLPEGWVDTVRHTLAYLGPRVQATRMVRDYVTGYYAPAAASSRAVTGDLTVAKDLAAWKDAVRAAWPNVRVLTVDTSGIGTEPSLGNLMTVRTHCALGGLTPADVTVQAVIGRVDVNEQLHDIDVADMDLIGVDTVSTATTGGTGPDAVYRYEIALTLARSGPVGYTVRILPRHDLLAAPSELGLVTTA
jgi:starch phosphorylase